VMANGRWYSKDALAQMIAIPQPTSSELEEEIAFDLETIQTNRERKFKHER